MKRKNKKRNSTYPEDAIVFIIFLIEFSSPFFLPQTERERRYATLLR